MRFEARSHNDFNQPYTVIREFFKGGFMPDKQTYEELEQTGPESNLAEFAFTGSEMKFRLLTETIQDVFWMSTPNITKMIYVSPAYEKIWRKSTKQLYESPRSFLEAVHPEDLEQYLKIIEEFHAKGKAYQCEYRILPKPESIRWIHERGYPIIDEHRNTMLMTGLCTDITERKRVEKELQESEEQFRQLFENMSSGVAVYEATKNGKEFVFKDFNKAAEKIDQIAKSEVIGKSVSNVFPGVVEFGLLNVFQKVWRTGLPEYFPMTQYEDKRIAGWRENYVYKLPSGEIVSIYDDITERKRVKDALQESEKKYRQLFENSTDFAYTLDLEGNFTNVNNAAEDLTGYTKNELIGMNYRDYTPKGSHKRIFKAFKTVLIRGESLKDFPLEVTIKDGSKRYFETCVSPLWEGNDIIGVQGSSRDITKRKQMEDKLRESEERFRNIAENSLVGVYIVQDNTLTYVNPKFAEIFGYSVDECLNNLHFLELVHPDDVNTVKEQVRRRISGEAEKVNYSLRGVKKSREIIDLEIFGSRILLNKRIAMTGMMLDVTKRGQLERQLQQAQKMEAIGTLAGGIAHDFNNILTIILGNTELALMQVPKLSSAKDSLKEVRTACNRAKDLTKQILTFSRQSHRK